MGSKTVTTHVDASGQLRHVARDSGRFDNGGQGAGAAAAAAFQFAPVNDGEVEASAQMFADVLEQQTPAAEDLVAAALHHAKKERAPKDEDEGGYALIFAPDAREVTAWAGGKQHPLEEFVPNDNGQHEHLLRAMRMLAKKRNGAEPYEAFISLDEGADKVLDGDEEEIGEGGRARKSLPAKLAMFASTQTSLSTAAATHERDLKNFIAQDFDHAGIEIGEVQWELDELGGAPISVWAYDRTGEPIELDDEQQDRLLDLRYLPATTEDEHGWVPVEDTPYIRSLQTSGAGFDPERMTFYARDRGDVELFDLDALNAEPVPEPEQPKAARAARKRKAPAPKKAPEPVAPPRPKRSPRKPPEPKVAQSITEDGLSF